jgi:hypothetical protein
MVETLRDIEHEKPKSADNGSWRQWFTPEGLRAIDNGEREKTEIPPERRANLSFNAGMIGSGMAENLPKENNNENKLVDELLFLGGTLLMPELTPVLRAATVGNVIIEGTPYDKTDENKNKKTAN